MAAGGLRQAATLLARCWLALPALLWVTASVAEVPPVWGAPEIDASRTVLRAPGSLADKPRFGSEPLDLFVVVDNDGSGLTIVDGKRFAALARLPTRAGMRGLPVLAPDGRHAYAVTHDGWLTRYDLFTFAAVAEVRVGIATRAIAVSSDGRWVLAGNAQPASLVVLDAVHLSVAKIIQVNGNRGQPAHVSAVYDAPPRGTFIVTMEDIAEAWEIPYAAGAAPVFEGLVHDYRMGEALAAKGPFPVRRVVLDEVLDIFALDPACNHLIGVARAAQKLVIVNLNVRRTVTTLPLAVADPAVGVSWMRRAGPVLAVARPEPAAPAVIDLRTWQVLAASPGAGARAAPPSAADHAFIGGTGDARDTLLVVDKETGTVVARLTPAPGKALSPVASTTDGRQTLVAITGSDGALVVYDSMSLQELRRLPLERPTAVINIGQLIARPALPGR